MAAKRIKLETKTISEREVKLVKGWKVKQEVDSPAMYAPHIPDMFVKTQWSEWKDKFTWVPRKSIYEKIIWGKVQYRHEMNAWGKVPLQSGVKQWATKKEVFESRLRGDRELVVEDEKYRRKTANA